MALASSAAKLLASLELDTKPFEAGTRRAGASLGILERRFGKIGGIAQRGLSNAANNVKRLGIVAAGFVTANVVAGVRSLEDLERVTNATKGVITSTGGAAGVSADQVRSLAQQLENLTTADDKAIQEGENMLLTFTSIGKETFPRATKAVTNLAIAMADGDVNNADFSRTAIQVGKALNDPIRGVTSLRRVGVQFTDQQTKQIKKMVEAGKVTEAQTLILAELEKEFGKAGEAAGQGFGADMRRFQDAVEDAQQALARGLLPVISRVSEWLTKKLAEPGTMRAIEAFGRDLAGAFDQIVSAGKKIPWQQIGDSMKLAGQGAKAALDLFTGLPSWVQTAVLTGWGLNKLTGGALGGIVGELGKGLIKGVLGMNAGVVNINAGVVNGGGVPGGKGGAPGGAAVLTKAIALGVGAIALPIILDAVQKHVVEPRLQEQAGRNISGTEAVIATGDAAKMQRALDGIRSGVSSLDGIQKILYDLNANGVKAHTEGLEAALVAAIDEAKKESTKNLQPLPDQISRKQASKFQALRDKMESNRIATVTSQRAIVSSGHSDRNAIVTAIRQNSPKITVNVDLHQSGDTIRVTKNYQTGQNLGRTGGQREFD